MKNKNKLVKYLFLPEQYKPGFDTVLQLKLKIDLRTLVHASQG